MSEVCRGNRRLLMIMWCLVTAVVMVPWRIALAASPKITPAAPIPGADNPHAYTAFQFRHESGVA